VGLVKPALIVRHALSELWLLRRDEMASYSLVQAAEMARVSKATIWRLVRRGAVSASRADDGSFRIEASEFERYLASVAAETPVPERLKQRETAPDALSEASQGSFQLASLEVEITKLKHLLELERERVTLERQRVEDERRRSEELRRDRDEWREQAQRLALPPPASIPDPAQAAPRRRWRLFG
jgi:Helix-turn-helix domain